MQLEIITPEMNVFSGEAEAVQFPGLEGSFQVLTNHSAIISALSKGEVKVNLTNAFEVTDGASELIQLDKSDTKVIRIDIKGGVMEMLNNKVIVLAE
jgi:F-type H+-transporting ATPase subunit epsilon